MNEETREWLEREARDCMTGNFYECLPSCAHRTAAAIAADHQESRIRAKLLAAYRKGLEDAAGRLLDEVERLKAERDRLARALDTIGRPAEHHGGAAHCEACADVAPALTLARRILSQDKEEKENETSKSEGDSK